MIQKFSVKFCVILANFGKVGFNLSFRKLCMNFTVNAIIFCDHVQEINFLFDILIENLLNWKKKIFEVGNEAKYKTCSPLEKTWWSPGSTLELDILTAVHLICTLHFVHVCYCQAHVRSFWSTKKKKKKKSKFNLIYLFLTEIRHL